jgi:3-oxoacyl-[acyl-carrier protein] reductase
MHRLKDKVAIVTGSSSGIGKAIALRFGAEGANVIVTARRMALSEQTVAQITKDGGEAWAIQTDVADEGQVERLIEETVKRYGRLDILVNNAGVIAGGRLAETTTKAFDEVMNVNLRGTFFCCRAGFKQMKKQGGGMIINMSSVAGVQAWAGTGTYSASKAGVIGLTKSLGKELAKTGIRVNCVTPAAVRTAIFDQMSQQHIDFMLSKIPLGRFGQVEEIAALVAWLCSEECSFSTGAVFDLSGGRATY